MLEEFVFVRKGRASLVAVTPVTEHPMFMCTIDDDGMRHASYVVSGR